MKTIGKNTIARFLIVAPLLILIVIKAIPNYIQGAWPWQQLPNIANVKNLQNLRKTGLKIPKWEIKSQKEVTIGGRKWSLQILTKKGEKPITLLLQPQIYYKDQPGVEWVDIKGVEAWKNDSFQTLKVSLDQGGQKIPIITRFFRAWNQRETFAVLQWYATPKMGDFSSGNWFWADLFAQLKGERVPWVAVSVKIPIEPLGDIQLKKDFAESFVKIIQNQLITTVFDYD